METTFRITERLVLGMNEADARAMIRERAFELSEIRRELGLDGSAGEDWCQAAAEIEPFVVVDHSN